MDFQQVQANADGSVTPTNSMDASDLVPTFANLNMSIGNIGFDPTHHVVLGDITISGDVSSALGNLTPGDAGTIKSVIVYPNEDHSVGYSIAVTGTKKTSGTTLLDPYDFSGHFSETFDDVEVDYGDYAVDVAAIDPVSHESATETLTANVSGMATDGLINYVDPNPRNWQRYTDVEFDSDPGLQDPDYTAPEFHGYLLQLVGSPAVLSGVSTITTAGGTFPVKQFTDGNYYAYSINSSGGATVPMVMHLQPVSTDWNPTVPQPADDDNSTASFVEGLAVGFGSGFPSLVSGTWTLIKAIPGAIADYNPWTLAYNYSDRYCNGDTFDAENSFISATGSALSKVGDIATQLATDPDLVQALLTGDTNTVGALSPDLQATLSTIAEFLVKLQDQFSGLSKYDQGRIIGRTIFEVGNLIAGGQLLKLGKVGLLKSLSNLEFFQDCAPAKAALAALQPFVDQLSTLRTAAAVAVDAPEAADVDSLLSLYINARNTQTALSPWEAWVSVFNNAAAEAKSGVAIAEATQVVMADAYKVAAETGDYSKLPTYTDIAGPNGLLKGFLKKSSLQTHHTIPIWLQKQLMTLTGLTWNMDSVPAFVLPTVEHTGAGPASFHNILDQFLVEGRKYSAKSILDGLQEAYAEFKQPNIWTVDAAWLASKGIK